MLHNPAVFNGSHPPFSPYPRKGGLILQVFLDSKTARKHLVPMVPPKLGEGLG